MTPSASWHLTRPRSLAVGEQAVIRDLAGSVEDLDGAEPLNEHSLLHLSASARAPAEDAGAIEGGLVHLLAHDAAAIVGYAQLGFAGTSTEAEILVGTLPDRDLRVDLAADLIAAAEAVVTGRSVLVWARGASPITDAARARGYTEDRVLLTMRRPLAGLDGSDGRALTMPPDVRIRPFEPGRDDAAWLAVNAAAFATHPEQGAWTQSDLDERLTQPWFDASGFLLAEDSGGELLGYHWTKVHPPTRSGPPPIGEVYVLGIAPSAQGRGLGGLLLAAGLRHLAVGAAREVILYVEEANAGAVGLYQRDGFVIDRRDVQFRGQSPLQPMGGGSASNR